MSKRKFEDVDTDSEVDKIEDVRDACMKSEGLSQLHIAAARGDTELVGSLLMSANVNKQDKEHNSPLHYASQNGHVDVVNLLLSNGASVNYRNASGQTSLYLASKNGHLATVQLLLSNNAAGNAVCNNNKTPLHVAAECGYADILQSLICNGAIPSNWKTTRQNWHTSSVDISLDEHVVADVGLTKQSVKTPLSLAAENGHAEVTDLLLRCGVCDFVLTKDKETPLHIAVVKGHTKVVEVILKHSSRISSKLMKEGHRVKGWTSIGINTTRTHPTQRFGTDNRFVSAGISWTEEINPLDVWRNSKNRTALDLAIYSSQPKMVNLLLNANQSRPTHSEEYLRKSFQHVLRLWKILYKVIAHVNNIETALDRNEDDQNETAFKNIKEIAQALINSNKFSVNHQDEGGDAPLHDVMTNMGCVHGVPGKHDATIYLTLLLLMKDADFNLKNSDGETPLIIASKKGFCKVIQIMFYWEKKSKVKLELNARDQFGATALIKAAEGNHASIVRILLNHKASVNLSDYYGCTALHAVLYERSANWFDFYFFCKGLLKHNFYDVSYLKTNSKETLRLGDETVDPRELNFRLQSHIQRNQETIRLRENAAKLLLDNDETNVNDLDARGNGSLDLAMKSSMRYNSTIMYALISRGAIRSLQGPDDKAPIEVARVDNRGRNPLHRLIISRISDSLFNYHVTTSEDNEQDEEIFDFTVGGIQLDQDNFKELATATDYKGRTPLHYAAMSPTDFFGRQHRIPMKTLLEIGSDVNAVDIYGKTALHYAEGNDQYKLLVHYGAGENTKDNFEYSPRDLKKLRDLDKISKFNVGFWTNLLLLISFDTVQIFNANHVTELTRRKLLETIRIYSQSPRSKESAEEAVWKIWTENKFIRINRCLRQLTPPVKHFVERLANVMKEKDWRFECQSTLVGSAEEETKVVISADFDFNFELIKFSQISDPFPHPLGPKGYFELRRKKCEGTESWGDERFDSYFNSDHCLLTDKVNSRFKIILEEVLSDPGLWQGEHNFDWNMKHKSRSRYDILYGLCKSVRLRMIHPIEDGEGGFLFVKISIDIIACVHVLDWWPEDPLPVGISPSVKTDGCTFVFHRPSHGVCKPRGTHFVFSDSYARISFAPLESRVIRESSPLIKAAYMVCKMNIRSVEWFHNTYQLKTCLLFCMEAFNSLSGSNTRNEKGKDEEITPEQLAFWVQRIMLCFMEFSRRDNFPCYFMPSIRRRASQALHNRLHGVKRMNLNLDDYVLTDGLPDIGSWAAYGLYLDLCPDFSTFDIQTRAQIDKSSLDPNCGSI